MLTNDSAPTARGKTRKSTPLSILAAVAGAIALAAASLAFAAPSALAGSVYEGNITTCPAEFSEVTPTRVDMANSENWLWTTSTNVTRVYVKSGDFYTYDDISPATSGSASSAAINPVKPGDTADISHIVLCGGTLPPPPCDLTTNEYWNETCVPKCPADEIRNQQTGVCEPVQTCDPSTNEWWNHQCVPKCQTGQVRDEETGQCEAHPTRSVTGTLTCSAGWSVTFTNYGEDWYIVRIDGEQVAKGVTSTDPQTISGPTDLGTGMHVMTVYSSTDPLTLEFTSPQVDCTPTPPITPPITPPTVPGGPTPVIDYCANLDGVQWEGYDCATGAVPPVVVAPIEVVSPEAATVPQFVPAPKPAKVTETPVTPEKATVPAAVPAGGGSSSDENAPNALLLLVAIGASMVCLGATTRLVVTRSRW